MSHDAIVLGGGPAGASAGLLLARAGWDVVLFERQAFPRRKVCGEYLSATNLPLLDELGLGARFRSSAGPPVRRVGLFAGRHVLQAALPQLREWGRALGREHFDTVLLDAARGAGVDVRQPWTATGLARTDGGFVCQARCLRTGRESEARAPLIVAAHGSWESGRFVTQPLRRPPAASDLLGFKAHFVQANLDEGLMPLIAFAGGYGGMVHSDAGHVVLSCCIRRDRLDELRRRRSGPPGEVLLASLLEECSGVRQSLAHALREGPWLAAGPIRPGVRLPAPSGLFPAGNAAGEAHPVIAEGISMALQSSWLLTRHLLCWRRAGARLGDLPALGRAYAAAWTRQFATRLQASRVVAAWAMRPAAVASTLPLLHCFPALLKWGARLSGKVNRLR